jgi:hypothetical protein
MILTVDDLVQEVRDQVDEPNTRTRGDASILRVLNRGQRLMNQLLAQEYPEPLLKTATLDLSSSAENDIPEDAFEDRAEYIEISIPGAPQPTRQRKYADSSRLYGSTTSVPWTWHIEGRKIKWHQIPSGAYDARVYYPRRLDQLVMSQGRVTEVGADYISVDPDSLGDDLSSSSDQLGSYIYIVNWRTGEIRGTFQISSKTAAGRINLRTSGARSTVLGRTVSGSAALATSEAAVDDYICLVHGTCVPYFQDTLAGYLVQYAVDGLTRSLGGDARMEQQILRDVEDRVAGTWSSRGATERIQSRSGVWPTTRRVFPSQS